MLLVSHETTEVTEDRHTADRWRRKERHRKDAATAGPESTRRDDMPAGDPRIVVLALTMGVVFLLVGVAKLVNLQAVADQFAGWGYPTWFMYLIGGLEFGAAFLLFNKYTRRWGAALIALDMAGAMATHVRVGDLAMLVAPGLLFIAAATVFHLAPAPRRPWILQRAQDRTQPRDFVHDHGRA